MSCFGYLRSLCSSRMSMTLEAKKLAFAWIILANLVFLLDRIAFSLGVKSLLRELRCVDGLAQ
jgi:hypothetical protein